MNVKPQVSEEWYQWIAENLQKGVIQETLLKIMCENNFDAQVSENVIKEIALKSTAIKKIISPLKYGVTNISDGHLLDVNGQKVRVLARLKKPSMVLMDNFLSHQECDTMISLIEKKLTPSKTVDKTTGDFKIIKARSSEGSYFRLCENDFITTIDERIGALMNFPIENGEGIQVLRYPVGGEYKAHFDYFDPKNSGSRQQINRGGNRVATLVMYLNDVEAGGETLFPKIGFAATPKKGAAVYFESINAQKKLDPMSLHAGAPVIVGEKWIATKWVRERRYG
ncbi:MAG: 2OG-Fe(II) oxygenase [Methylococcales bacterium]|nr:2OG-Fe(II) oxygenase [Methylococcales bacterium]